MIIYKNYSAIICFPKTTNDSLLAKRSFLPDFAASIVRSIQSKELIADKFIDLEGDTVYRLERYSKADSNSPYAIKDVWTTKRNHNNALLTEENEIFTKLIFPLNINVFWNGNAFNNRPYQEYTLESIHAPYQNQLFSFDSSLTVIQSYKLNLLEYESAKEVYVSSVGLVYKEDIEVKFVPGNQNIIEEGYEYYQELISN